MFRTAITKGAKALAFSNNYLVNNNRFCFASNIKEWKIKFFFFDRDQANKFKLSGNFLSIPYARMNFNKQSILLYYLDS
jgi:hypothetical protein